MSGAEHWESQAERWAMWARRPNFDGYWSDSGPPFFALLPPPGRRTLEVGCGEGRVTRDLKERGHSWAYPLEDYTRALEEAGFLIESLREPA
jgi:SAM-dependent methyltransferase